MAPRTRTRRLPCSITDLVLRDLANLSPQAIGAACGRVISAGLMAALIFEGWPGALLRRPGAGRVVTLVFTAAVAVGLNRALAGYADSVHWVRATANDWVTVAGLAFSAVGIILHVAIGQRWPLSPTIADEDSQQSARARATADRRVRGDHRRRRASSGDKAVETPVRSSSRHPRVAAASPAGAPPGPVADSSTANSSHRRRTLISVLRTVRNEEDQNDPERSGPIALPAACTHPVGPSAP